MKKALVIGANGQDGTFLVRHLIASGRYNVIGVGKQDSPSCNINSLSFQYLKIDLREENKLSEVLRNSKPDLICHVAVVHTSAGGAYETLFRDVLKVNVGSVYTILEYQRERLESIFIYASSAKVFGTPLPEFIHEDTPKKNQCLYSISKNTAFHLIDYYRKNHGCQASVVHLFNHESELRPDGFFIPTILKCLVSAMNDDSHVTHVNTLDFYCDWGSAKEYMSIMMEVGDKAPTEDFVVARGVCLYARDFVRNLFARYGLDYKDHIKERGISCETQNKPYAVILEKLRKHMDLIPVISIDEVCKTILSNRYGI